jgi:hypothetical protein
MKMKARPQLFIDTNPLEDKELALKIFDETDKYSITPTTFKARKLNEYDDQLITVKKVLEKNKDYYTYLQKKQEELEVLEHQFLKQVESLVKSDLSKGELIGYKNTTKPTSDLQKKYNTKLTDTESYLNDIRRYLDFIVNNKNLILKNLDVFSNEGNEVVRCGIDITNINPKQTKELTEIYTPVAKEGSKATSKKSDKISVKNSEKDILLHPLEILLIQDAVNYLQKGISKTVLVDIFVRNDDGSIRLKGDKPDTHTIVLYKTINSKYAIIDPSNSEFSQHLNCNINISRIFNDDTQFLIPSKQIKIYSPADKDNVGPNPNQYRDCIDIAVKIAFCLNRLEDVIDINNIESLNDIIELSNNISINSSLSIINNLSFRIRQASKEEVKKLSNEKLNILSKQLKSIGDYPENKISNFSDFLQIKSMNKLSQLNVQDHENYEGILEQLTILKISNQEDYVKFLGGNSAEIEGYEL